MYVYDISHIIILYHLIDSEILKNIIQDLWGAVCHIFFRPFCIFDAGPVAGSRDVWSLPALLRSTASSEAFKRSRGMLEHGMPSMITTASMSRDSSWLCFGSGRPLGLGKIELDPIGLCLSGFRIKHEHSSWGFGGMPI